MIEITDRVYEETIFNLGAITFLVMLEEGIPFKEAQEKACIEVKEYQSECEGGEL